jgi:hypothetical protein
VIGGRGEPAGRPTGCRPVYACTGTYNRRPAAAEHEPAGPKARKATIRGGVLFGDFLLRQIKRKLLARKRETSLSCRRHDAPARVPAIDVRSRCDSLARFPHPALCATFSRRRAKGKPGRARARRAPTRSGTRSRASRRDAAPTTAIRIATDRRCHGGRPTGPVPLDRDQ